MFFSVSTNPDHQFSNRRQCGNLWVNYDSGWQQKGNTFYKGYADNYCRIIVDNGVVFEHSQPRSFPLWYQHGIITNLPATGEWQQAWVDDQIVMNSYGVISATKNKQNLIVSDHTLTIDQAILQLMQQLNNATEDLFTHQNKNLKLFCSGGLDTSLLYSMLTAYGLEFELVKQEHYEHDAFTMSNSVALESFWAYKQIHHWLTPAWLATGSHGDEYFLRGPAVIAMLTSWHDINIAQLLEQNITAYHYRHFKKYTELWSTSWENRHKLREQYHTRQQLNQHIINNLINDHQHWHLGNTITWTPFKNIQLAKILLQCDIVDLIPQFLDGQVTKTIINKYSPTVSDFVSKYKNHNSQEHLSKFFAWHNAQK
jgi:hypothetical protein